MKKVLLATAVLLMSGMAFASGEDTMPVAEENLVAQSTDAAAEQDYLMIDKHLVAVDLQALVDDGAQGLVYPGGGRHGGGWGHGHGGGWGRGHGGGWGRGHGGGWGHGRGHGGWRWRHGHRGWGRRGWWYPGWGAYPGFACYAGDADGYTYAGRSTGAAIYSCQVNSASQGCRFLGCD